MLNSNSDQLPCDSALFPAQNSPNSAKSNRSFHRIGRGDRALTLTYLDSPVAQVIPSKYIHFFRFRSSPGEKEGSKLNSSKNLNPSKKFKLFCLLDYYLWRKNRQNWTIFREKIGKIGPYLEKKSAKLDHIWRKNRQNWTIFGGKTGKIGPYLEEKAPENHFMNAEIVRKVLKDFNLTTTNAILIKLTTIMYLREIFNLTKKLGRSS